MRYCHHQINTKTNPFNHVTATSTQDALNIRPDYVKTFDLTNREWNTATKLPACYTSNITPTIKARFTVEPVSVTNVSISAVTTNPNPILQNIVSTNIVFQNGVSVGDAQGYVSLKFAAATPTTIRKTADTWKWKSQKINNLSVTETAFTNTTHTIYNILKEPETPWNNTFGSQQNAWTNALDFAIAKAGANNKTTAEDALSAITSYLHTGHGLTYDTINGEAHYTEDYSGGLMNLTAYINKTSGKIGKPAGVVNCYDQAAAVCSFGSLLGIDVKYNFMQPFGYINKVNLIGVGNCNNPFFNDPSYLPLVNMIPLLNPPDGITPLVYPARSGFGNHAFAVYSGNVFDACSGPSLGKPINTYLSDTIDTHTSTLASVAGGAADIDVKAVTSLK